MNQGTTPGAHIASPRNWSGNYISNARVACFAVVLMAACLSTPASGQICLHGALVAVTTFSTNCQGLIIISKAHVGSTVGVLIRATMADDCPGDQTLITNVTLTMDFNSIEQFQSNVLGYPVLLPSLGSISNIIKVTSGPFANAAFTYVVQPSAAQYITNMVTLQARDTNSFNNPNGFLASTGSEQTLILRPSIAISQFCTNGIGANGMITFGGTVQNTGDTTLTNVFVLHNQPTNSTPILGPITLTNGESRSFSGAYQPNNHCAPATGVLSAFGTDELLCTVSASATQTCSIALAPCINITIIGGISYISCVTESNKTYTVQFTHSLSNNIQWQNLTNFQGTGLVVTVMDPVAQAQRFYRFATP